MKCVDIGGRCFFFHAEDGIRYRSPSRVLGYVYKRQLMGLASGLVALPRGLGSAYVLTQVIQPRAFGWTMGYTVDPWLLAQALLLTLFAAGVAARYPAWRVARTPPADALRME